MIEAEQLGRANDEMVKGLDEFVVVRRVRIAGFLYNPISEQVEALVVTDDGAIERVRDLKSLRVVG